MYLLDTNVVIEILRGNERGKRVMEQYNIPEDLSNASICTIVQAELYKLAHRNQWGEAKIEQLRKLLENITIYSIEIPPVIKSYAMIASMTEEKGRKLSHHDAWIAATAYVHKLRLITFDKDFEALLESGLDIAIEVINNK